MSVSAGGASAALPTLGLAAAPRHHRGSCFALQRVGAPLATAPRPRGLVHATRSSRAPCTAVLDLKPTSGAALLDRRWAVDCIAFNESAMAFAEACPQIGIVVLPSAWVRQTSPSAGLKLLVLNNGRTGSPSASAAADAAIDRRAIASRGQARGAGRTAAARRQRDHCLLGAPFARPGHAGRTK